MIRVFLVEGQFEYRHELHLLIEGGLDIEVVGEARLGREALALIPSRDVDVVVCDYCLPDMDGFEVTTCLLCQRAGYRILILSSIDNGPLPRQVVEAGALGYVIKGGGDPKKILQAIRDVAAGRRHWDDVLCIPGTSTPNPFDGLSPRTSQVAMLTIRGLTISEIAVAARMSESAVRSQRQRMFEQLPVDNDIRLLRLAQRYGLGPIELGGAHEDDGVPDDD